MKVVLDTNVIISAIFFGGNSGIILEACTRNKLVMVVSPAILREYQDVSERIASKMPTDYQRVLDWIAVHSEMVADRTLNKAVSSDPDDDKFIATALESTVKIICSGDKHLLDVNGYCDIEVLKPKPFLDKYLKAK